ncbi:MAG: hypothetical protein M3O22_01590 [Pseudomonadota bacterium]|nr:hypothetical protein [Pseudomonadota bacterium]
MSSAETGLLAMVDTAWEKAARSLAGKIVAGSYEDALQEMGARANGAIREYVPLFLTLMVVKPGAFGKMVTDARGWDFFSRTMQGAMTEWDISVPSLEQILSGKESPAGDAVPALRKSMEKFGLMAELVIREVPNAPSSGSTAASPTATA